MSLNTERILADRKNLQAGSGSDQAEKILSRSGELAVLPHVVFKLLELSGSTENAAVEIERVVAVDPGFSARILALANSSYYGLSRKVTSVRDAVVYLGFKNIRDMALTTGVFDMFVGKNDKDSLRRRDWWRTSVDAGIVCRLIASHKAELDCAEAYTCGLLHYIGKSILDRYSEADYTLVERQVAAGIPVAKAERNVYGCNHTELAAVAGKKWGFPAAVASSALYLEKPEIEDLHDGYRACVALSNKIARLAVGESGSHDDLPDWAMDELGIALEKKEELYQEAVEKIAASNGMQF
jgi:HD-like signal output (HDOD) protein